MTTDGHAADYPTTTKDTKNTKNTKELENETLNAIFQPGVVKVDQYADLPARQFHVREQLGFVNPLDRFDALQFDDRLICCQ